MLLQLVPKLPEGEQWQYEVKWDGYRGIAVIQDGPARLWSRNERDLGKRFPGIVDALATIPTKSAVIDGELVLLDESGKPSFQGLQYFDAKAGARLHFYVFDLLHLDGRDYMERPLIERRGALLDLVSKSGVSPRCAIRARS